MALRTTVFLIDDHELVRCGIRSLLESQSDFRVVADAPYRPDVVALAAAEQPDVIILAPATADDISLDAIPELTRGSKGSRVLVLTNARDLRLCRRSVMLGAVGVLDKRQPPDILFKAIAKIHAGEVWLDRNEIAAVVHDAVQRRAHDERATHSIGLLTKREREVVAGICDGLRNKELAERLFISEATVRNHVTSILDKLQLTNRFDLVVYSYRCRLVDRV